MKNKIVLFDTSVDEIEDKIQADEHIFNNREISIVQAIGEIHVNIATPEKSNEDANCEIEKCKKWFIENFNEKVVSIDGHSLERIVGDLLKKYRATIAVAESCTGGLISHKITNIPGSSKYFLYSGVVYSNKVKIDFLDVCPETIEIYGAVHKKTASEMADGVRRLTGADYGLSTTGISGPGGGTKKKPVGTVCIGLATPGSLDGYHFNFSSRDRIILKELFALTALNVLRKRVLSQGNSSRI